MKNSDTEPPGRLQQRRTSVIPLTKTTPAQDYSPVRAYRSVDDMVHELRPEMPVHCLRPTTIAATAKRFLKAFPGDVMYSVKSNPDPLVLRYLARAGVKRYDVASLSEVKLIADLLPEAEMYFMHPVKSREAISASYDEYGVRDFSLDSQEELEKILDVTNKATDLNLYVRLSMPNDKAAYSLTGKFGIALDQAVPLLTATRAAASRLGVCFHVGSQCMSPDAYLLAIQMVANVVAEAGVQLDILDIGGGFPSLYPGMTPPPLPTICGRLKRP